MSAPDSTVPRPPAEVGTGTPMQRDEAVTIYERSREGRRAAVLPADSTFPSALWRT